MENGSRNAGTIVRIVGAPKTRIRMTDLVKRNEVISYGAVTQLGECYPCKVDVESSSLSSSTATRKMRVRVPPGSLIGAGSSKWQRISEYGILITESSIGATVDLNLYKIRTLI